MPPTFEIEGLGKDSWKRLTKTRWTLCIGAGINGELLPDWSELTREIVNEANGTAFNSATFSDIVAKSGWSLDAWIQQAMNRHLADNKEVEDFSEKLRDILYGKLLTLAESKGLRKEIVQALNNLQQISRKKFDEVASFFEENFANTTVYKLADILTDLDAHDCPVSILNFNADTFLETFLLLLAKKKRIKMSGNWSDPPQIFSRIVRSSDGIGAKIPIYYLHGCLPPRSSKGRRMSETPKNMVFPENSYSRLAGRMFSWSQSVFLYHAQADSLCFVGLSMADANIRRWLSWTFEGYAEDLSDQTPAKDLSGKHVWINAKPSKAGRHTELYAYALRHLGVQVCWLRDWRSFDKAFKNLLGLVG